MKIATLNYFKRDLETIYNKLEHRTQCFIRRRRLLIFLSAKRRELQEISCSPPAILRLRKLLMDVIPWVFSIKTLEGKLCRFGKIS